ncbi:DUF368 domain-containing protein [Micrococcus lylae]|uniref:DUF368 domain-containing protein n=1 Tax=Micrococcus lylae TaxID=1273 RepID=UPI0021A52514|nr:DUF368 domain-containing protein [Micrococcus lylae]MCT2008441.1 DUF368 domain-containing protein [Micrococcus lylae]MCT2072346.1 DUF368 domain-containing protein [Micrococcus lylae]
MPSVNRQTPFHVLRGAAIGAAEVLPGISGGTVMMIVGIYEHLIRSAGHFVGGIKGLVTDKASAYEDLRQVRWDIVIPVVLGMFPALLLGAKFIAPAVEDYPIQTFGVFFGMSVAAVLIPIMAVGTAWNVRTVLVAVVAGIAAFLFFGLPIQQLAANPFVVFFAAAIAICALALPGLSGSFLLLSFGLYEPTLNAVNNRDWGYLAIFAAGAILGLGLFVRALQRLLENHRGVTLAVVTGLMVGALRALWPWQLEDERVLLAPTEAVPQTVGLMVAGAAVVLLIAWLGHKYQTD